MITRVTQSQAVEFNTAFGTSINKYMDKITGFDICAFAEYLFPDFYDSDESLEELITKKHGAKASEFIRSLIA